MAWSLVRGTEYRDKVTWAGMYTRPLYVYSGNLGLCLLRVVYSECVRAVAVTYLGLARRAGWAGLDGADQSGRVWCK